MSLITLIRGTVRTSVIDGDSARVEKARMSALNRSVAQERLRMAVSIGTTGIYPGKVRSGHHMFRL